MIETLGKVPSMSMQAASSPVVAVSSDRAGMESFFETLGVEYVQLGKWKDDHAREDAALAARQFDALRKAHAGYHALRKSRTGRDILQACRKDFPPITERGVIDGLAICFINDIVGYGCFVQHDIAEGTHIGIYAGIVSAEDRVETSAAYVMRTNPWYIMLLGASMGSGVISILGRVPKMIVDAEHGGNELRFANHIDGRALLAGTSVEASNITLQSFFRYQYDLLDGITGLFHVICVAARDIQAGEELRFDYGFGYWGKCDAAPDDSKVFKLENDHLVEVPTTLG